MKCTDCEKEINRDGNYLYVTLQSPDDTHQGLRFCGWVCLRTYATKQMLVQLSKH